MRIGVLALQGAFAEHERMLQSLGVEGFEIRRAADLRRDMSGLIIPGGESTTMAKLLNELEIFTPLSSLIAAGLPVFGTCAGLILLASSVEGGSPCLGAMEITACRNAYGRQLGSFAANAEFADCGEIPMVFIRAPYITNHTSKVQILARVEGRAVAAVQGNILVTAFHPELTDCTAVHEYFLKICN